MTTTTASTHVDVRPLAPRDRHPQIFSTFDRLGSDASMELVNDHDPKPLLYQLQAERAGQFRWEPLESGPDVWRVRIHKVGHAPRSSTCCGGCGGS